MLILNFLLGIIPQYIDYVAFFYSPRQKSKKNDYHEVEASLKHTDLKNSNYGL